MSVFDQWLLKTSPGDITSTTLLMLGLLFLVFRVWPWWTKSYIPSLQEIEKQRMQFEQERQTKEIETLKEISSVMYSLKEMTGQNQQALYRLLERDSTYLTPAEVKPARKSRKRIDAKEAAA